MKTLTANRQEPAKRYKALHKDYLRYVEKCSPKQAVVPSLARAFGVGGLVCCIGQAAQDILKAFVPTMPRDTLGAYATVFLVFLTVLFTGIGLFDKIGYFAGAGTFLPISGFANSIASAAVEFKSEGIVFGLSSKFFSIAGPVIVNGVTWAFLAAGIRWLVLLACGG
ncbi:MAG: SpoVA/SpoVAEb family sporulation membrane protein [Clostridiales bacterium]|jgi:stage V sporulation protein AC|nr:SpoVA/SpoVAEb family sporulation membrane protein [Clostridiales bacterium]